MSGHKSSAWDRGGMLSRSPWAWASPPRADKGLIFQLYSPAGQKSCQDLAGGRLEMAGRRTLHLLCCGALQGGRNQSVCSSGLPKPSPMAAPHLMPTATPPASVPGRKTRNSFLGGSSSQSLFAKAQGGRDKRGTTGPQPAAARSAQSASPELWGSRNLLLAPAPSPWPSQGGAGGLLLSPEQSGSIRNQTNPCTVQGWV